MDKRVILAVAGSGKTTHIVEKLDESTNVLIITYTINNIDNLRLGIIRKFGYFPNNIKLISYFAFLYSFCYKPILSGTFKSKGIDWKRPPEFTLRLSRKDNRFYLNNSNRLYSNRIAKLFETKNIENDIVIRLEKYYESIYIDEIQDFAGHDFNFLKIVSRANINILFVGDFFQHTFDTSSDGNVNSGIHNDYKIYIREFENMGLVPDNKTLIKSYRCSTDICDFIRERIGIEMYSKNDAKSEIKLINNQIEADKIFNDNKIVKLFYQEHYKYNCFSQNWGNSKGQDHYFDVCVVQNSKTFEAFNSNTLGSLPAQSKNKFYVACSRARNNLYFVPDTFYKKYKDKTAYAQS